MLSIAPPSLEDEVDNEYEFDLILQETENVQINSFDDEDLSEQVVSDEYDLSNTTSEIFDDPELLLNYIEKFSNETNPNNYFLKK